MSKPNRLIGKRTKFLALKPLHLLFHLHYWFVHDLKANHLFTDRPLLRPSPVIVSCGYGRSRREFPSDAGHQPLNPPRQAKKHRHPRGSPWTSPWGGGSGMSCWGEISRRAQDTLGGLRLPSGPGRPCCSPGGAGGRSTDWNDCMQDPDMRGK